MISHPINRVQAIKSKFENLNNESTPVKLQSQLYKHRNECERKENKENSDYEYRIKANVQNESDSAKPNASSLYKIDVKRSASDSKTSLTRQSSDPGKKLHRSHAFRCDRSQKLNSPKRHGSCNGRSETSEFLKMERKLSKDKLKRLGNVLEAQMKKENFVFKNDEKQANSIPDEDVPPHILVQYAQVIKPKRDDKQEAMTDSGVSSETENLDDDKSAGRVKKIMNQFETTKKVDDSQTTTNLDVMENLAGSSETMKLEHKNPHLILTDTLKKALKQPLPVGPPPQKPPRKFPIPEQIEKEKSDTKRKLEKLEQVLLKREARKEKNIYDIVEENTLKRPKEVHYLCTEILDITQKTLLPNQNESGLKNCFNKLNCSITSNSMSSLPYLRLSSNLDSICTCADDEQSPLKTFLSEKCSKCHNNDEKHGFKCHLKCQCKKEQSEFFLDEPIYDEPYTSDEVKKCDRKSEYGTLNGVLKRGSTSSEELSSSKEDKIIYDEPYNHIITKDTTRTISSDLQTTLPGTKTTLPDVIATLPETKTEFQKLRENFENSGQKQMKPLSRVMAKSTENLLEEKPRKNVPERKFATEVKRYRPRVSLGICVPKRNPQLDVDRENLNRLMDEIYETVTAACIMEENKPGSFPTDTDAASEESSKLTRSLTEKRKNYVRRVSSRLAYLEPKNIKQTRYRHQTSICSYKPDIDNPYSTFRSWKSFRTSQNNLTKKMETDSKFNLTDSKGNILSMKDEFDSDSFDNLSIDEKTGCVDIELPFEAREGGLFNLCLVVGLNYMTGEAYVRSVFPSQVQVPQHIENLVFPETLVQDRDERRVWSTDATSTQCYSFVLTDERGERSYGYCRRVLPEGGTSCLPLCYCLIGKFRAPGFYYKVLQELESHHGSSEEEINSILQQLYELDFPSPGDEINISLPISTHTNTPTEIKDNMLKDFSKSLQKDLKHCPKNDNSAKVCPRNDNSAKVCPKNDNSAKDCHRNDNSVKDCPRKDNSAKDCHMKDDLLNDLKNSINSKFKNHLSPNLDKSKTLPDMRREGDYDYCDFENNNGPVKVFLTLENVGTKSLKFPLDPRAEETSASQLLDSLGAGLLIKVFGSLLLERKIIIRAEKLSVVSSLLEALQGSLYPFVWQQPLVSLAPREIQAELVQAPLPLVAGVLPWPGQNDAGFEEGMFIDLTLPSKVLFYQGDESTILPTTSYKTLKTSLQMESTRNKDGDTKTRNLLISETFLRFFVDILGDFWRFFHIGVLRDGDLGRGDVVFDKESFIKSATSKQNQYFLDWFTETAMFNHFIQNMAVRYKESYMDSKNTNFDLKDGKVDSTKTNAELKDGKMDSKNTSVELRDGKIDSKNTSVELRDGKMDSTKTNVELRDGKMDSTKTNVELRDGKTDISTVMVQNDTKLGSTTKLDIEYKLIDTPTPNFYQLFEERVLSRRNSKGLDRPSYKNALHKRVRLLKSRLKDLVG